MQFDFAQQPGIKRWNADLIKTAEPLVSIITPFYNSGTTIQQTANCVFDQTFPFFEWILVDDGSTAEEDIGMLDVLANEDPRVVVLHKKNGGASSARNLGIRNSRTEYILPLDADDLLEPTFLEYCWWMLSHDQQASWAYTESCGFQGMEYIWKSRFDANKMKRENLLTVTALIRKSALESVGCYMEGPRYYNEDWHAWLRMVAAGYYPVQSLGEPLFWYRRSDTGAFSKATTNKSAAKENKRLIAGAADKIHDPHPAVIYPQSMQYAWSRPKRSDWNRHFRGTKKRMHILFLFPHLEMGGADKFNLDLITGLAPDRFETGVITTNPADNAWLQRFRLATPNIFCLSNFMCSRDYAEFISYYIESRQPDVLFVSNSAHGYALVPWLRQNYPSLPIVDYVHMEEWYWRNGGHARSSGGVGACLEKTYVCNTVTERVMVEHFARKPETVETVHIGVDANFFAPESIQPGQLYRELRIDRNRPIVLFICRLHPQKRPFLMLEIAKRVSSEIPEVAFAVVGNGPQEEELRRTVGKRHLKDTVYFLGAKQDVRSCYRDAKVTLVCSVKEGLSLTAYESCAMGVPVISADVGGQKDLVDETVGALIPCTQQEADSFDKRTFDTDEVNAYADAICRYLRNTEEWENTSRSCRQKILNGFTIEHMVHRFEQEFQRLVQDTDLMRSRKEVAAHLAALTPMAAELYTMEMQMQCAEDHLTGRMAGLGYYETETILMKIRRVYTQGGIWHVFRKGIIWIQKRLGLYSLK